MDGEGSVWENGDEVCASWIWVSPNSLLIKLGEKEVKMGIKTNYLDRWHISQKFDRIYVSDIEFSCTT